MNKTDTIARMRRDGTVVEVLPDGTERPFPNTPMRPMTEAEIAAAAAADPDARPMTEEEFSVRAKCRAPRPYAALSASRRRNSPDAITSPSARCAIGNKAAPNPTNRARLLTVIAAIRRACAALWKQSRAKCRVSIRLLRRVFGTVHTCKI